MAKGIRAFDVGGCVHNSTHARGRGQKRSKTCAPTVQYCVYTRGLGRRSTKAKVLRAYYVHDPLADETLLCSDTEFFIARSIIRDKKLEVGR